MSHPIPAISAPASTPSAITTPSGSDPLYPAADSSFEERWGAWQARGRRDEAATRRHALIGAPLFALIALGLYLLLGRG